MKRYRWRVLREQRNILRCCCTINCHRSTKLLSCCGCCCCRHKHFPSSLPFLPLHSSQDLFLVARFHLSTHSLLLSSNPAFFPLSVPRLSSRVSSPSNLFRCKTVRLSLASLLTREQHHGRLPHTEYKRVGGWQNLRNSTLRKINANGHASESRQIYIVNE